MTDCPIVELRQYTLHPGQRETLIELFDREFVESQEAAGIRVLGQFRDTDRPDRFVWLRGFPDMESRARSLAAFYGGATWKTHRDAANATMIDSDNVLLLRPAGAGFDLAGRTRDAARTPVTVVVTIYTFREPPPPPLVRELASGVCFVTEHSPNTFPRLPVREGEHVLVAFGAAVPAASSPAIVSQETLVLAPTARSLLGYR